MLCGDLWPSSLIYLLLGGRRSNFEARYAQKNSWIKAVSLGSAIALIIAGASIIIGRFLGWRQSLNPDTNALHGGEHVLEIDGILTVFGWLMLAQSTALFTGLGATVALFVWWLVGEPSAISGEV